MKRFVDLRNSDTGYRFAWYDTITDKFESHSGDMAWDTFDEFAECYEGEEIDRYRGLCSIWAFERLGLKQVSFPTLIDGVKCPNCGECALHGLDKKSLEIKCGTAWGVFNLSELPTISCRNCGAGFEEEANDKT